jgi:hypothetical protein
MLPFNQSLGFIKKEALDKGNSRYYVQRAFTINVQ